MAQNQATISQLDLLTASNMKDTDLIPIENSEGTYAVSINELIKKYAYEYQEQQLCGAIQSFAHTSPTEKWLLCNGAEVSKEDYPNLYAKIGDIWGTPTDSNKFKLPNFTDKGRALRSFVPATDSSAGLPIGTYQDDAMQKMTGKAGAYQWSNASATSSGVLKGSASGKGSYGGSNSDENLGFVEFDNSLQVRTASETRMVNGSVAFYIHI